MLFGRYSPLGELVLDTKMLLKRLSRVQHPVMSKPTGLPNLLVKLALYLELREVPLKAPWQSMNHFGLLTAFAHPRKRILN